MESIPDILLNWFITHKRALPWRLDRNAYHILLSEVIMQQTRIEQGLPYYLRILDAYPTIQHLAASDEVSLLRLWQGLGYYSRARNLHHTAKYIVEHCNGIIPDKFEDLRKLKGIGNYTAAAIASMAFDEPIPVVDGNVIRVISRLFIINAPSDSKEGKKMIKSHLDAIFSKNKPGFFNEAIMEFGALQCVISNPNCAQCPLMSYCKACKIGEVNNFPIKKSAKEIKIRHLNYLCILDIEHRLTIMQQRHSNDVWKKLYEFLLIETVEMIQTKQLHSHDFWKPLQLFIPQAKMSFVKSIRINHKLTHRLLKITITLATIQDLNTYAHSVPFSIISLCEAEQNPKPVVLANFLKEIL